MPEASCLQNTNIACSSLTWDCAAQAPATQDTQLERDGGSHLKGTGDGGRSPVALKALADPHIHLWSYVLLDDFHDVPPFQLCRLENRPGNLKVHVHPSNNCQPPLSDLH